MKVDFTSRGKDFAVKQITTLLLLRHSTININVTSRGKEFAINNVLGFKVYDNFISSAIFYFFVLD